VRLLKNIHRLIQQLSEMQINIYAANASFFTLLSAIPGFMLILAVISVTPLTTDDFLAFLEGYVPSTVAPILSFLSTQIIPTSWTATISITALAALWSASRGVLGLLYGLNAVYHVPETRGYLYQRLISVFYMVLLMLMLLLMLLLHVFGQRIQALLVAHLPRIAAITASLLQTRLLLTAGLLTLVFTVIYTVFPNRRIRILRAVPGAVGAAVGWLLCSYGFSIYINSFARFSVIYGNLTTVILTILWLYFCIYILLCGGVLNYLLEQRALSQHAPPESHIPPSRPI
jgi:membrane protein